MIHNNKIYKVSTKMEINLLDKLKNEIDDTILDCEYYNNKYYIFDVIFYNKKDITKEKLSTRIDLYKNINKKINLPYIRSKKYYEIDDICKDLPKFIEKYKKNFVENKLDGLILTPNSNYYDKVYKYKPLDLISIDFKIKKLPDSRFALLKQNGKIFNMYGINGIIDVSDKNYQTYKNGDVVEFVYSKSKFIPLRGRPDKTKSNWDLVIKDNLRQILYPESIKEIVC